MVSTQLILLTNQLASHWLQTQLRPRCFHKLVVLALEGKIQTSSSDSQGCPPLVITTLSCPVDWALKWILSYCQANAKTQWVLKLSSNSHCDNSMSAVAKEIVVGWHLSFAVAPKYFQKHCNYRKFLVYVYTLTQSTGPKLYQLIFYGWFCFPLICFAEYWLPTSLVGSMAGSTLSASDWAPFALCLSLLLLQLLFFFATNIVWVLCCKSHSLGKLQAEVDFSIAGC